MSGAEAEQVRDEAAEGSDVGHAADSATATATANV